MIVSSTRFLRKTIVVGVILAAATLNPAGNIQVFAKPSDVQVKSSTVNCKKPNTKVRVPGVGVSVPNPGKLVPNVGKILRKGVGVPAPDSNAPHVGAPKVSARAPGADCPTQKR